MKKIKQMLSVILVMCLIVPQQVFSATILAPAGIGETGLEEEVVRDSVDIVDALLEALRHKEAYVRIDAAKSLENFMSAHVVLALSHALEKERDEGAYIAEAKALFAIGEKLKDIDPYRAISAFSVIVDNVLAQKYYAYRIAAGINLITYGNDLLTTKWDKKLEFKEKINFAYLAILTALKVDEPEVKTYVGRNLFTVGEAMRNTGDFQKAQIAYCKALDYANHDLKKLIVELLGGFPDPAEATTKKLIEALKVATLENKDDIADTAEKSLINVGNEQNVKIIITALEKSPYSNVLGRIERIQRFVRILLNIGKNIVEKDNRLAANAIMCALKYGDSIIRFDAVEILGDKMSDFEDVYGALCAELKDGNLDVCGEAAVALGKNVKDQGKNALMDALKNKSMSIIGVHVVQALENYSGEDVMNALAAAVIRKLPDEVRCAAAEVLEKKGSLNPTALKALLKGLKSRRPEVAKASAIALGNNRIIDVKKDVKKNIAYKSDYRSVEAYGLALKTLRMEALKHVFHKKKGKKYIEVRVSIANTLSKLEGISAILPVLIQGLLHDKAQTVRSACAGALGEIGDARANDALIKGLKDKHPDVRRNSAKALGKIGSFDNDVVKALFEALEDNLIAGSARAALWQIEESAEKKDLAAAASIKSRLKSISYAESLKSL